LKGQTQAAASYLAVFWIGSRKIYEFYGRLWPVRLQRRLVVLLSILSFVEAMGIASGDHPKPAKVIVAGHVGSVPIVSAWLVADPLTDPTVIPARAHAGWTYEELYRYVRLYFPRSYAKLLEYEYMMLLNMEIIVLTPEQQKMLHDSIYLDGLGGMQTRSVMSVSLALSTAWAESILSEAFPNDADAVVRVDYSWSGPMRVVINTHPQVEPILKPYIGLSGVEASFVGYGTNLAIPKPGAIVTSYSVGPYRYGYSGIYPDPRFESPGWIPHTMYWTYGKGVTWTHQDMIGGYWDTAYNPFAPDMLVAELLFSTGRKLPEDVVLVHWLRRKFADFGSAQVYVISLAEFIERFGANAAPVMQDLKGVSEIVDEARGLYLALEYQASSEKMGEALERIGRLGEIAVRLKERALFWIYLVEWLVVSGAFMLAGVALWTLMVRRRLYREVSVTRMSGA